MDSQYTMEAHNTQDLHELVTLEPNNDPYASQISHTQPQQSQLSTEAANLSAAAQRSSSRHLSAPVFTHSSSIFSPGYEEQPPSLDLPAASSTVPPRQRLPFISLDTPSESSRSPRWSQLAGGSRLAISRKAPIQKAEKDSDDVDTSLERPPRSFQLSSSTNPSATLNRLFAGKAPHSPEASREPSYQYKPSSSFGYTRCMPGTEPATLSGHLHQRGLIDGRHSDIIVKVFNHSYALHRLILDRAPFFASALSEPWAEAHQREIELHPEEVDNTITQRTFELALKRLYGCQNAVEEDAEAIGLFATGCWLEMQDLIDSSVDSILRRMQAQTVAPMLHLVTANYYGKAGEKIMASAKAVICRNGWQMPLRFWDGISSELICELVGGDGFFVHGEWERWLLAKRLLDRRLKAAARELGLLDQGVRSAPKPLRGDALRPEPIEDEADAADAASSTENPSLEEWINLYRQPEIVHLLALLDGGIHYVHLEFEQLQSIRSARDVLGIPYIPDRILAEALWASLDLRQRVLNARDKELTLGLSHIGEDGGSNNSGRQSPLLGHASAKKRSATHELRSTDSLLNLGNSISNQKQYWIPSSDCNIVLGGNSDSVITSTSNANRQASRLSSALQSEDSTPWFNDLPSGPTVQTTDNIQPESRPTSYSTFPPFRFSAEFPNPRVLKERKRVYSRTVFYAGSLWNVYIQKVRSGSKNPQLGVYLHRAKERDPEGSVGAIPVDERIGALEREMVMRSQHRSFRQRTRTFQPDTEHAMHSVDIDGFSSGADGEAGLSNRRRPDTRPGLSTFMASTPRRKQKSSMRHSMPPGGYMSSGATAQDATPYFSESPDSSPDTDEYYSSDDAYDLYNEPAIHVRSSNATLPAYIDARPTIKTYFKIYSPSKGGRMMSVYESAPDNFNFSQSWGWKSSSLMLDDELDGEAGCGLSTGLRGEDGEDEPLAAGVVGAEAEGVVGGAGLLREDDVVVQGRANLRFMVVLGVV